MKRIPTFVLYLVFAFGVQAGIPTPESAMGFRIDKDPRKWTSQYQNGNRTGFIVELVPEGDSIKNWKEMTANQIAFTTESLRRYVDSWKEMVRKADAKIDLKEETMKDGSIFVTYTSLSADEMSIRRFIKGKDGVYMLAYHVRPKLKKDETLKIWEGIVRNANLVSNPEKGK
jgi:hypothetical protein